MDQLGGEARISGSMLHTPDRAPGRIETCTSRILTRANEMRSMANTLHDICDALGLPQQAVHPNEKTDEPVKGDGLIPGLELSVDDLAESCIKLYSAVERIEQASR